MIPDRSLFSLYDQVQMSARTSVSLLVVLPNPGVSTSVIFAPAYRKEQDWTSEVAYFCQRLSWISPAGINLQEWGLLPARTSGTWVPETSLMK